MQKKQQSLKWVKRHISYYIACGVITLSMPALVHAAETEVKPTVAEEAEFDSAFLIGDAKKIDVERFKFGNPILPGEYNLDVYVNGNWFGKHRIVFKALDNKENAFTCFSENSLIQYGVKPDALKKTADALPNVAPCQKIEQWIDDAYYEYDSSRLRIDISIPQIAMQKNAQGYVDPSVWDRGINAAFLSYNASAYKTFDRMQGRQERTNAFTSINAGANLAGWQFRHNGQWQWQDGDQSNNENPSESQSSYDAVSTYVQRAFPKYRAVLTLGDSYTNGEIFDSFGYRGVDISSDDRMLPNSMIGYAPRIRGNAKTNAKVEVRQQGQLIYQTTVAPGNFEINDLYPTGFGGELEVAILEASGEIQRFNVPYASVVQMLRPGMSRYSITAGQFRDKDIDLDPWIVQAKYQRGLHNYITAFTGVQSAEDYTALTLGSAFATPVGAISLDVTHSQADFKKRDSESGQSYRLSYSKLITPTNTNLTLAAYRYSTENFYKLRDALMIQDLDDKSISSSHVGKQRSEFQITLNQGLPDKWGNVYATGSWVDYWNRQETTRQYQIGYSNTYSSLTYGLSAIKRVVEDTATKRTTNDTEYMLTLSLPWTFKKNSVNFNSITTQDSTTIGMSGTVGDRFNYGTSVSDTYGSNPSMNVNAQYRTNFATVGGSYSVSDQYQQAMLSARGNVVAHSKGVLFGPDQGQTMVLVYAPEAAGAKVNNATGLSINKSGYAVIPYVTPYRLNDITLDPQNMSTNVELEETSQRIAPYAGAISQVSFATKSGKAIYIHGLTSEGKTLPFAAEAYSSQGENVGMVAQGSMVYLRTNQTADTVTIKWGDEDTEQCRIQYDVTKQAEDKNLTMITTEGVCQ
ncbi:fimbrial biogenesis outer membrane usher protein [Acinetobacter sp. ANC 5033]|uniref:fimbria/pilus outer membrane usher protein n=1 Tax=Acinetobacter amyesii TaxID=2942470 RepID=UPI00201B50F0|nr:fimbria/pilus outer membrane usher protein [Acinetobacter amyesii]MCL6239072.1 fimbrial biogenesis outer membrane usher protein [Acinetobacter amyesii]